MLTRRAKAYSSSGSEVTHRSTNRARRRVTSFQSKRIINYATPPTSVPWRHLVNDIDLRSPKSLKSLTPACAGVLEPRGSGLGLLKCMKFQNPHISGACVIMLLSNWCEKIQSGLWIFLKDSCKQYDSQLENLNFYTPREILLYWWWCCEEIW